MEMEANYEFEKRITKDPLNKKKCNIFCMNRNNQPMLIGQFNAFHFTYIGKKRNKTMRIGIFSFQFALKYLL
jgi:hypothetical protein